MARNITHQAEPVSNLKSTAAELEIVLAMQTAAYPPEASSVRKNCRTT
jgi:hypothetical protein